MKNKKSVQYIWQRWMLDQHGVYRELFQHRIKQGWDPLKAATQRPKKRKDTQKYLIDDIWGTINFHANRRGISPATVRYRMAQGEALEKALEERDPSLYQLADICGISAKAISYRMKLGMSKYEAIQAAVRHKKRMNLSYRGQTGTFSDICDHFRKSRKAVEKLMNRGKSFEEAMDMAPECRRNIHELDGILAPITKHAKRYGVYHTKVYRLMANGKTLREAIDKLVNDQEEAQ